MFIQNTIDTLKRWKELYELLVNTITLIFGIMMIVAGAWTESVLYLVIGFGLVATTHLAEIAKHLKQMKR